MKKLITTFVLFSLTLFVNSQTVVSSCKAPDSIVHQYLRDADRLTLRKIFNQNLTYTDSIIIPQSHSDTILKALLAVYNATAIPARNTVISVHNIHSFPIPNVHLLEVAADSNLIWMNQLKLGTIPTGNTKVDGLISKYHLSVQNYKTYGSWFPYHIVTFISDSSYNLLPLVDSCNNITGVFFSNPATTIGDGNNITASIYPNYVELIYSMGWGDCPSGCIYRHYWTFHVYYNCTVEFLGESGSPLLPVSIPMKSVSESDPMVIVYPNPANEFMIIELSSFNSTGSDVFLIYNNLGQLIREEKFSGLKTVIRTEELSQGIYYLKFKTNKKEVITRRMAIVH